MISARRNPEDSPRRWRVVHELRDRRFPGPWRRVETLIAAPSAHDAVRVAYERLPADVEAVLVELGPAYGPRLPAPSASPPAQLPPPLLRSITHDPRHGRDPHLERLRRPLRHQVAKQDLVYPLDPDQIGRSGSPIGGSLTKAGVSPETHARILAMAREYEDLARELDARYATGRIEGVDALEHRAEELADAIDEALAELVVTEPEPDTESELDQQLAAVWQRYLDGQFGLSHPSMWPAGARTEEEAARLELVSVLRGVVFDRAEWLGVPVREEAITPEALISAAQDAHDRRNDLRRRHARRPKLGLSAEELRRRFGRKNPRGRR